MSDEFADPPRHPPPSLRDWLLVAINVAFVAGGLVILPGDRDTAIVTLAFFGSCLVVSVATILRKRRFMRFAADRVVVVGGVPIRPKAGVMVALGAWLLVLGVVLVAFGRHYPWLFRALSGFVALVGGVLLVAALTGNWPGGYLQFDPDFLTIAQRRWRARIAWGDVVSVLEGEFQTNPVLLVTVADPARLDIAPPGARMRALSAMARTRGTLGADFAIMTTHYGIDLPVLAATVERYAREVSARAELRPRLL